jgi:hypothetical protein
MESLCRIFDAIRKGLTTAVTMMSPNDHEGFPSRPSTEKIMNAPRTDLESYLQDIAYVCDRIRDGRAPEPLTDEMMDKLPKAIVPAECDTPAPPAPKPIEIPPHVEAWINKDEKRRTMKKLMTIALSEGEKVTAARLTQDGYIRLANACDFLMELTKRGALLVVPGAQAMTTYQGSRVRLTVFRLRREGETPVGAIPARRAA